MDNTIFDDDFYDPTVKELKGWIKPEPAPHCMKHDIDYVLPGVCPQC